MLTATLAAMMILGAPTAEAQVEEAMRPVVPVLRGCFISRNAPSTRALLRFRIDSEGKAQQPRLEKSTVEDPRLDRCLVAAVSNTRFPEPVRGRDVAYPLTYQAPKRGPAREAASRPRFRLVQSPRPLGDTWMVVAANGQPVSDLDLALATGASGLHAELRATRNRYVALAVAEGLLAAAAVGVAGYGAYGLDQHRDDPRNRDVALLGGGLLTAGVSGVLMLFHGLRAIDTSVGRPVWHHVDQATARRLVDGQDA